MPVYVMLIPYGAPRLTPAQLLPARGPKCVNKKKKRTYNTLTVILSLLYSLCCR